MTTALRVQVRARGPSTPLAPSASLAADEQTAALQTGAAPLTDSARLAGLRLCERAAATTCAYCHDPLDPTRHDCGCGAAYHRDCWAELGKCGTLGCLGRADADDRRRGGRCPQCYTSVHQALPWERLGCAGCGAVYHLGCRLHRARCATRGCRSGDHDAWGAPAPPTRRPLLGATQRARLVRALSICLLAALTSWGLLAATGEPLTAWALGALVAAGASLIVLSGPPPPRRAPRPHVGPPGRFELLGRG